MAITPYRPSGHAVSAFFTSSVLRVRPVMRKITTTQIVCIPPTHPSAPQMRQLATVAPRTGAAAPSTMASSSPSTRKCLRQRERT
eukprot:scaffold107001_cov29-Tisochrysis_lutea.AAC.3